MPTEKGKDSKGEFYQWGLNNPKTKKYYLKDYEKPYNTRKERVFY